MKTPSLGAKGEDLAARFLKKKGLKILKRNYRCPIGEIDIIAKDGNTLVFVEVKTRCDVTFGHPSEAVNYAKKKKIEKAALYYMTAKSIDMPARFDVVSICITGGREEIDHLKDAFEVGGR